MDRRIVIRCNTVQCWAIAGGDVIRENLTLWFLGELFQGPLTHNPLGLMVFIEEPTDRHSLLQKTRQLLRSHRRGCQDWCGAV